MGLCFLVKPLTVRDGHCSTTMRVVLPGLSPARPVGFKLCIGRKFDFMAICKAIMETGICPDFITTDGAEGGIGAAPVEYSNRFGLPCLEGVNFVHNCLLGVGRRDKIKVIASGKTATGLDIALRHKRVASFQQRTLTSAFDMIGAMGLDDPDKLFPHLIWRRGADEKNRHFDEIYPAMALNGLFGDSIPSENASDWAMASAETFAPQL